MINHDFSFRSHCGLLALKNGDADEMGAAPTDSDPYAELDDEKGFNRNQPTFGAMSFNTIFRGLNRAEPLLPPI